MSVKGRLPENTSLFCSFHFRAGGVESITHGTPCHWSDMTTVPYWALPVFYATHNFLLPVVNGAVAGAVYHEGMPSWGYDAEGNLLGNLLRNTLGSSHQGAIAADRGVHTQHYALRAPSGLSPDRRPVLSGGDSAATGWPLLEALQFNTPMIARPAAPPPLSTRQYPAAFSLAEVTATTNPMSSAIITAAKPAESDPANVVLRLYQTSGDEQDVTVRTAVDPSGCTVLTALEGEFKYLEQQPNTNHVVSSSPSGFTLRMKRALATVVLPRR
jgi:alpha-mannosidase